MRLKKGSAEARAYMAKIRGMRKGYKSAKRHISPLRHMASKRRRSYRPSRRWFRRRGHRADRRLPLLPALGLANAFVNPGPIGRSVLGDIQNGDFAGVIDNLRARFTGFDSSGVFRSDWVIGTYMPIVVGFLGSKVATAAGANKVMKRIPIVGRYIKL